jgi:glycolate oxidase
VIARGAGTGIAGGAIPRHGGLVIATSRLRTIQMDAENRAAIVQPGVVNAELSEVSAREGLFFAPDPSSQKASTLGGNIGTNAGGPHCLALGVTVNHVLALCVILHDGAEVHLGGCSPDGPGYDLVGLFVGSEGTFGVVAEASVRLTPTPESVRTTVAIFPTAEAASAAVSAIIGAGLVPAALEMMDRLALSAVEAAFHAGYPPEAGAILLVEVDGLVESVEEAGDAVDDVCRREGALESRVASTAAERQRLWAARKGAAGAMGRIAPNYYLHDAVVPRTRLPEILHQVETIGRRHDLPIANLFHAGDGNLHPMILFDARQAGILERVTKAGREILTACIDAGGTITGEHGVGLEKQAFMPLIFDEADLDVMARVRAAIDPDGCLNPDKILPTGSTCLDAVAFTGSRRQAAMVPAEQTGGMWV